MKKFARPKKQHVIVTRKMDNETFARHVNARHLGNDGEIYPIHFSFMYGLETIWRGWHMNDHKEFPHELDHRHTED